MNSYNIIISIVLAAAYILIYLVATTQISTQYPWLISLGFFLLLIPNLIGSPNLGNKSIKITKVGVMFLLIIILFAFLVTKFHQDYDEIRTTTTFRIVLAVILFPAWLYDIRHKAKNR
jgi:membrane-anchored protein YejM (alkaline phosphatase superfamily)